MPSVSFTSEPMSTGVPASGACATTVPGLALLSSVKRSAATTSPAATRVSAAPSGVRPRVSGTTTCAGTATVSCLTPVLPLAALPRTPNGKLDYAALPPPDTVRAPFAGAYMAPETVLERTIALAWQEVLALERVGLHDNFFDLGGNSLLLAQLHRRLQADLGKEIPIVHMLQHTTVSALVRYLAPKTCETAAIGTVGDCIEALRAGPQPTR